MNLNGQIDQQKRMEGKYPYLLDFRNDRDDVTSIIPYRYFVRYFAVRKSDSRANNKLS